MASQKFIHFISEPMANKLVHHVPGIGETIAERMTLDGIATAQNLYGFYLINPREFRDKVASYGANASQQDAAYKAMRDYTDQHN